MTRSYDLVVWHFNVFSGFISGFIFGIYFRIGGVGGLSQGWFFSILPQKTDFTKKTNFTFFVFFLLACDDLLFFLCPSLTPRVLERCETLTS